MADVKIISDASYDKDLHLTGYAGGVFVSDHDRVDISHRYSGVAAEHENIQQGEMLAILVGVRELYRRWDMMEVVVDSLKIYCDNQTCIDMLSGTLSVTDDHELMSMVQTIHEKLAEMNVVPLWMPISSHKPDIQASGIEKRHNEIDRIAGMARKEAISQMLAPDISSSQHVALLMPGQFSDKKVEAAVEMLGRYMAKNKIKSRLFIDAAVTSQEHPFTRAVEDECRAQNIPLPYLCKVYYYNAQASRCGMDMTLLRYHVFKEGHDPHFSLSHTPAQSRAAIASRLLFGDPNMTQPYADIRTGRKFPPSKIVFDLMAPLNSEALLPNSVQGWVHTYLRYIKMPLLAGVSAALRYYDLVIDDDLESIDEKPKAITSPVSVTHSTSANQHKYHTSSLMDDLRRTYMRYDHEGDDSAMIEKMIRVMQKHGAPNTTLFKQSMERFMFCNIKNESSVFLRRVVSQMKKLIPDLKQVL